MGTTMFFSEQKSKRPSTSYFPIHTQTNADIEVAVTKETDSRHNEELQVRENFWSHGADKIKRNKRTLFKKQAALIVQVLPPSFLY